MPYEFSLSGGLGDCIKQCYSHKGYELLDTDDTGICYIHSHNYYADELVKWHPSITSGKCKVINLNFSIENHSNLKFCESRNYKLPVHFYGIDYIKLKKLISIENYVVLTVDSSLIYNRSFSYDIIKEILSNLHDKNILLIGNTYNNVGTNVWKDSYNTLHSNIIDLRNKLNVPETLNVIKNANYVITPSTSILVMSWLYDIPRNVYITKELHKIFYTREFKVHGYVFDEYITSDVARLTVY
jgi:hypothetical protein